MSASQALEVLGAVASFHVGGPHSSGNKVRVIAPA